MKCHCQYLRAVPLCCHRPSLVNAARSNLNVIVLPVRGMPAAINASLHFGVGGGTSTGSSVQFWARSWCQIRRVCSRRLVQFANLHDRCSAEMSLDIAMRARSSLAPFAPVALPTHTPVTSSRSTIATMCQTNDAERIPTWSKGPCYDPPQNLIICVRCLFFDHPVCVDEA